MDILAENGILIAKITPWSMENVQLLRIHTMVLVLTEFNVFRIRDFSTEFVFSYLNRDSIRKIATDNMVGIRRQRVPTAFYEKVLIAILPMQFQLEIQNLVKDSHKALEESKQLYKKAEEIFYN